MEMQLLTDVIIVFALALLVVYIFSRLKIPPIIGFFITGILAGPHGLNLIKSHHEVEILAEIGVVLQLFTIGIEFSVRKLIKIRKAIVLGGSVQVLSTILITFAILYFLGFNPAQSVFAGFLAALSSTAIVMRLLQGKGKIDSPEGRTSLSILIYQDLIIVPMMLLTPILGGAAGNLGGSIIELFIKIIAIGAGAFIVGKWFIPFVFLHITRTRSRELFLMGLLFLCMAMVFAFSAAGLSVALGAFIAGLVISDSDYSHEAMGNIAPFRDVFTSFFFISIGMLLDLNFFADNYILILSLLCLVVLGKMLTSGAAAAVLGMPTRIVILVAFTMFQVGEFSFVLSRAGIEYGLLDNNLYQLFLAVSVLTMALTPILLEAGEPAAKIIMKLLKKSDLSRRDTLSHSRKKDHVIIVGYGINGRNVAKTAKYAGIDYVVLEMNPDTVRKEKKKGEEIIFGDAAQTEVLHHAGIEFARVIVITIADFAASTLIIRNAKKIHPGVYIIVRTRYMNETEELHKIGADEVIPEEFETSIRIFSQVLSQYLIQRQAIDDMTASFRSGDYHIFRTDAKPSLNQHLSELNFQGYEILAVEIIEKTPACGKTLSELALRKEYGINVLAVKKTGKLEVNPSAEYLSEAGDVFLIFGHPEKISKAYSRLFS